jgi:hypothetical protein
LKALLKKAGWEHMYSIMDAYGTGGGHYMKDGVEFVWNKNTPIEEIHRMIKA